MSRWPGDRLGAARACVLVGRSGLHWSLGSRVGLGATWRISTFGADLERAQEGGSEATARIEAALDQLADAGARRLGVTMIVDASVAPVLALDEGDRPIGHEAWRAYARHRFESLLGMDLARYRIAVEQRPARFRLAWAVPEALVETAVARRSVAALAMVPAIAFAWNLSRRWRKHRRDRAVLAVTPDAFSVIESDGPRIALPPPIATAGLDASRLGAQLRMRGVDPASLGGGTLVDLAIAVGGESKRPPLDDLQHYPWPGLRFPADPRGVAITEIMPRPQGGGAMASVRLNLVVGARRRLSVWGVLLLVAGAVSLTRVGWQWFDAHQVLAERIALLQSEAAVVSVAPRAVPDAPATGNWRIGVESELQRPWSVLLQALEAAASDDVHLLVFDPRAERGIARVTARTGSLALALAYVDRLAHAGFGRVSLAGHERVADERDPIRFDVEIAWSQPPRIPEMRRVGQ